MKVILAAGGSGGHIFPSLALADELKKSGVEVLFVSSKRRLDMSLLGPSGHKCYFLSINPMPYRKDPLKYAVFFFKLLGDVISSARIVFKESPDAVLGFGGYSSGTISLCAKIFGAPLVIHEQNYFPGRANIILSGWADLVAVSFKDTEKFLPKAKDRTVWTGNPLRRERLSADPVQAAQRLGIDKSGATLLVMGGSQGATFLNSTVSEAVKRMGQKNKDVRVIHLTGKADYESTAKFYEDNGVRAKVFSFLDRMEDAYAVADMAISRAGASAVFELACCAKPMVLVPYPNPKNNQRTNAKFFADNGAALYKEEKDLTADGLAAELDAILSDGAAMKRMSESARSLAVPDAAKRLAEAVVGLVEKRQKRSVGSMR